jgi:glycosyltransferase involved in cell wall biosynthesis
MKIVFFTHYQNLYGANKSLANLLVTLQRRGYQLLVICPHKGDMTDFLNEKEIPNISGLYFKGWEYKNLFEFLKLPYRFLRSWITMLFLLKKLDSFDPHIIYSNSSVIWIGKLIALILKKPHIWHIREFGLKDYGLRMFGGKRLSSYLMNKSHAVIAISKSIEEEVLGRVRPEVKHQIYNGVVYTSEINLSRKDHNQAKTSFTFCMAGILIPSKGYADAIEAMKIVLKKFPDTRLLIAGKGQPHDNYEKYLHKLTRKLGLEQNVKFLGYVKDITSVYEQSDCFLMCSKAEGLGRVTIEAMAHGLPVIGYNSGGTCEIIDHDKNGFLYEKGREELAECMLKLMQHRDYNQIREAAFEKVKTHFTIEGYIGNMEKLFEKVATTRV